MVNLRSHSYELQWRPSKHQLTLKKASIPILFQLQPRVVLFDLPFADRPHHREIVKGPYQVYRLHTTPHSALETIFSSVEESASFVLLERCALQESQLHYSWSFLNTDIVNLSFIYKLSLAVHISNSRTTLSLIRYKNNRHHCVPIQRIVQEASHPALSLPVWKGFLLQQDSICYSFSHPVGYIFPHKTKGSVHHWTLIPLAKEKQGSSSLESELSLRPRSSHCVSPITDWTFSLKSGLSSC